MAQSNKKVDLKQNLAELAQIVSWFEKQSEIDLDASLEKVRRAAELIQTSRKRLKDVENSFKEIEKDLVDKDESGSGDDVPF